MLLIIIASMTKSFSYFSISLFYDCDFKEIVSAINQIKNKEIKSGKIDVQEGSTIVDKYLNPPSGGAHYPQFCCWESEKYPNKIFFISNYEDGLYTLCNVIHKHVRKNFIMCSLSNEENTEKPFFQFYYSNSELRDRKIMAYKENRWVFYEDGTALDFENETYYINKIIKKRLNNEIIIEYLNKCGVNLWEIDMSIKNSITYVQKAW